MAGNSMLVLMEMQEKLPCFSCLGDICDCDKGDLQFSQESYLKRGELHSTLQNEDLFQAHFDSMSCELFGFQFLSDCCSTDNWQQLFYMAEERFRVISNHCLEPNHSFYVTGDVGQLCENRMQLIKFLAFLKSFVIRTSLTTILPILKHLKSFLLIVGRISDFKSCIAFPSSKGNLSSSPIYHLFHLHLDVMWSVTAIYFSLPANISAAEHNLEYSSVVLKELVYLALHKFQRISIHDYGKESPFSCTCVRELWILLRHLLDDNHEKNMGNFQTFWMTVQTIILELLNEKINSEGSLGESNSDVFSSDLQVDCENRVGFCWWLLLHLTPLQRTDSCGNKQLVEIHKRSNYSLLQTLISHSFQSEKSNEEQLRCYLQCCILICNRWEPCADVLLPLSTHFVSNLNRTFCLEGSLDGFETLCPSGSVWLKRMKSISNTTSENSFHLFLRMTGSVLKHLTDIGAFIEWRKFKGRILSKFHSRKMEELNDIGIHNFISLFLTMACVKDFEDMSVKMMKLLEMISPGSMTLNKSMIVTCGLFAFLRIYQENRIDMAPCVDKLSTTFNNAAQRLKQPGLEKSERDQLMKLILVYVNGLQDVVEHGNLDLSEHLLINSGFHFLLLNCKADELDQVLFTIQVVLSKLRMVFTCRRNDSRSSAAANAVQQHMGVALALSNHILPFVKQHCTTSTPTTALADVAAGLTIMKADMELTPLTDRVPKLFHHFGLNSNVSVQFSSRFLCHMLSKQKLMDGLIADIKDVQWLILAVWFRSVVFVPSTQRSVLELTRLTLKLPLMESLMAYNSDDDIDIEVRVRFLKALNMKFSNAHGFEEKTGIRQNVELIFKDILKPASSVLKTHEPLSQLRQLYEVMGQVVKHCASIIYVKCNSDALLHSIIHELLLPRILYCHDKPMPPNLATVLKETIPSFVSGLMSLNPRRDLCINNRLKDIVVQYVLRFRNVQTNLSTHPLHGCLTLPELDEFYQFAVEVIRDNSISKRNLTAHQLAMTLKFLLELFACSSVTNKKKFTQILWVPMLNSSLIQGDAKVKELFIQAIQKMINVYRNAESIRCELTAQMRKFIDENMMGNTNQVFKVLEFVITLDSPLVNELSTHLEECIRKVEEKRGVGSDASLWERHKKLMRSISGCK